MIVIAIIMIIIMIITMIIIASEFENTSWFWYAVTAVKTVWGKTQVLWLTCIGWMWEQTDLPTHLAQIIDGPDMPSIKEDKVDARLELMH